MGNTKILSGIENMLSSHYKSKIKIIYLSIFIWILFRFFIYLDYFYIFQKSLIRTQKIMIFLPF